MKRYYAKHWHAGYGTTWAETGENAVRIRGYQSESERDAAVNAFRPPNHCPRARMEGATSGDPDVRRAIRRDEVEMEHIN